MHLVLLVYNRNWCLNENYCTSFHKPKIRKPCYKKKNTKRLKPLEKDWKHFYGKPQDGSQEFSSLHQMQNDSGSSSPMFKRFFAFVTK